MDVPDKGMFLILDRIMWGTTRFHHDTQSGMQFSTHELFISGMFHLMFLDQRWARVTETTESKTTDKRGILC